MIPETLRQYVEDEIIPRYAHFDAAHRIDHARMVIEQSAQIVDNINAAATDGCTVRHDLAYIIAACHDLGLCEGRDTHHIASARIIRADRELLRWFTPDEIRLIADAAEDHRASAKAAPRSIYGRIVAEADRFIDPEIIICRTIQFGLDHYPDLPVEGHYARTLEHLREKYGDGGYLHLWFPDSPNAARLEALRVIIRQPEQLRPIFDRLWQQLTA